MNAEPPKQSRDRQGASGRQKAFVQGGIRPLAYFLTYTCYGTWLHGDERGSVDRENNGFQTERVPASPRRKEYVQQFRMKSSPFKLHQRERAIVHVSVAGTCERRGWTLHALNVRTNHVHVVVSGDEAPDTMATALKAWASRELADAGNIARGTKVWTRGASTHYLWNFVEIQSAIQYVLEGQGLSLVGATDVQQLAAGRSLPVAAPFGCTEPDGD